MSAKRQGQLVVISGPSGVGKSTVCRRLLDRLGAEWAPSLTTRPESPKDAEGKPYRFVSEDEFQQRLRAGELLEHAEVFGHHYGTLAGPVRDALAAGRTVLLEIDVQGACQIARTHPQALFLFLLPPHPEALNERITGRARDTEETIRRRLEGAAGEIELARTSGIYDHMLTNDSVERTVTEIARIVQEGARP